MQGVEKNNDLFSSLYFSSANPLLTMLHKLYWMLEMKFEDETERNAMVEFARIVIDDFVENLNESKSSYDDDILFCNDEQQEIYCVDESEEQFDRSVEDIDEQEDESDMEFNKSMIWAPEKRFGTKFSPRTENRFKSFRRQ